MALDKKLREEEAWFQAGQSCMDQSNTEIRVLVESQSSLYTNLILFEKVFDNISVEVLCLSRSHHL